MLTNVFKTAIRNLLKNKVVTAINIAGLTLGITACLIIYLLTGFELSFDNFHPDKDRIYRAVTTINLNTGETHFGPTVPDPMAATIRQEFTGVQKVAQFRNYYAKVTIPGENKIQKKFEASREGEQASGIVIADREYFDIFRYRWLAGNAASMKEPFHVVLTESKARQYFGTVALDKIPGREILYNDSLRMIVSGIVKDYPKNSDFQFTDFIASATIPVSFLKNQYHNSNWKNLDSRSQTFVKLVPNTTVAPFEKQAATLVDKHMQIGHGASFHISLQLLADIHFNATYEADYGRTVHLPTLYGLIAIAVFILLIAAINFINLSTAQSLQRVKEIGIRKVLGSSRKGLVWQALTETFVLTLICTMLSLLLARPLINIFHAYLPDGIALHFNPLNLGFILVITIVTALLAGFYPAKVLSSYVPAISLKGAYLRGGRRNYLRKALIVFQFTISLIFIIGTLIIGNQIHYALNTDLGFTKDAIINIPTSSNYPADKTAVLAQQIRQQPGVQQVSVHLGTPAAKTFSGTMLRTKATGKEVEVRSQYQTCDENYLSLYRLQLVAGRNLMASDTIKEYLINETCARQLGFTKPEDAIGQLLESGNTGNKQLPVVGVVADYHSQSLHEPIAPVFMTTLQQHSRLISVRLSTQGKKMSVFKQTAAKIENLWKEMYPNEKFEYRFFDETIAGFYEKEQKTSRIMNIAMTIAILISCMGLFGLATFMVQRRTKEIGIRKVLGAGVVSIAAMLSADFLKLVLLALVIASPIAYYCMHQWLQDFAYRISISAWVFIIAGLSAVLITLLTISFQAIKAAVANPVKSLRTE